MLPLVKLDDREFTSRLSSLAKSPTETVIRNSRTSKLMPNPVRCGKSMSGYRQVPIRCEEPLISLAMWRCPATASEIAYLRVWP